MGRVTLSDIGKAVGFSKNTVSLALRGSEEIPVKTRERIVRVAEKMGYQQNAIVSQLMAQLRASRSARFQAKLALVNANRNERAFREHPTIPTYVEGCENRARKLGYSFDTFWLHDPELDARTWMRVLETRGVRGIVLVGLMDQNRLPAAFESVWRRFPTVVTGVRTRDPSLSFCCVDHHNLVLMAFEKALELGYRRPGLVIDEVIDALVERRFSAGFLSCQRALPASRQVPIHNLAGSDAGGEESFLEWIQRYKPDVVFTLYNVVVQWLKSQRKRIPGDIGVIQLEWRQANPEIAGMNQHNFVTGEAAVDMVVSQIHNNEVGVQEYPRATLIGASWVDGASVREGRPARSSRSATD